MSVTERQKILVVGSGFSGSLLAAILQKYGYDVTLIDKCSHPRFAIGESSTPTAGFILKSLVDRYNLQELLPLTRYGLWREHLTEIGVGVKRGFSYFFHEPGGKSSITPTHESELLVAASSSQEMADTHWYRQDVDSLLFTFAARQGVTCWEPAQINRARFDESTHRWQVQLDIRKDDLEFHWIIDASGASEVMSGLTIHEASDRASLETKTSAVFAHFKNVRRFDQILLEARMDISDFPFPSDDAAQHHVLQSEWLWNLRFDNGISSLGLVTDLHRSNESGQWSNMLAAYPSIQLMLQDAEFDVATPTLRRTGRLQRLAPAAVGPGWVALPNTIGFIDPLHSTGIAHALSGVERLAGIFTQDSVCKDELSRYGESVYSELNLIDQLIAGCYKMMPSKRHFEAYCMLYFAAAHSYETCRKELVSSKQAPGIFLLNEPQMIEVIRKGYHLATEIAETQRWDEPDLFEQQIRELISPFDQIGLCNPDVHSMYGYTAVL